MIPRQDEEENAKTIQDAVRKPARFSQDKSGNKQETKTCRASTSILQANKDAVPALLELE
jgi:hypothetical protein